MGKDPAVLFYTSDFLTGTMTMSDAQVGRYMRLLCLQHQSGHLTKKDFKKISRNDSDIVEKFIEDDQGLYYNERMEKEIIKRNAHCDKQRENILKRWNKSGNTTVLPLENENEIINIDSNRGGTGEKERDSYKQLFDYYLTLGLVEHKTLTTEMKNAIDTAKRRGGYDWDMLKELLRRHSLIVKLSENDGEFAVHKRGIAKFFGQRVQGGQELICSEYADGGAKWLRYQEGWKTYVKKTDNPERASYERPIGKYDHLAIDLTEDFWDEEEKT